MKDMDRTYILKENSEAIRKKITDAGISVCFCASFIDADWLEYSTAGENGVHGVDLFLYEVKNPIVCKDVDMFIERIKAHEAWVNGYLSDDITKS